MVKTDRVYSRDCLDGIYWFIIWFGTLFPSTTADSIPFCGYIDRGSPLFWIGIGVGLSAVFSWVRK